MPGMVWRSSTARLWIEGTYSAPVGSVESVVEIGEAPSEGGEGVSYDGGRDALPECVNLLIQNVDVSQMSNQQDAMMITHRACQLLFQFGSRAGQPFSGKSAGVSGVSASAGLYCTIALTSQSQLRLPRPT